MTSQTVISRVILKFKSVILIRLGCHSEVNFGLISAALNWQLTKKSLHI